MVLGLLELLGGGAVALWIELNCFFVSLVQFYSTKLEEGGIIARKISDELKPAEPMRFSFSYLPFSLTFNKLLNFNLHK